MKVIELHLSALEVEEAPNEGALKKDLDRTALYDESYDEMVASISHQQESGVHSSPARASFEEFWLQFHKYSEKPQEQKKYQQGLMSGSYIRNYMLRYLERKSEFNPESGATEGRKFQKYHKWREKFKYTNFAYPREDGTWGGLCLIYNKDNKEWVLCITQIQFNEKIDFTVNIIGRGSYFGEILRQQGNPAVSDKLVMELTEIVGNDELVRPLVKFISTDERKHKRESSWTNSVKRLFQDELPDLLNDDFLDSLRFRRQASPNSVAETSEFDDSAAAAEAPERPRGP